MRPIDADRALEIVRDQGIAHPDAYHLTNYATFILREAPTVDVVEVVRCSKCIGRSTWHNDAEYGCAVCGMSGMYPKSENGYCSYGLKRNNE